MTRGNQREIDRERARKRNADKNNNNKNEEKSDFFKNKDKYRLMLAQERLNYASEAEEARRQGRGGNRRLTCDP
jgi:hypothetical protein